MTTEALRATFGEVARAADYFGSMNNAPAEFSFLGNTVRDFLKALDAGELATRKQIDCHRVHLRCLGEAVDSAKALCHARLPTVGTDSQGGTTPTRANLTAAIGLFSRALNELFLWKQDVHLAGIQTEYKLPTPERCPDRANCTKRVEQRRKRWEKVPAYAMSPPKAATKQSPYRGHKKRVSFLDE